jgi:hypothetical protein
MKIIYFLLSCLFMSIAYANDFMASSLTIPEDGPVRLLGDGIVENDIKKGCESGANKVSTETANSNGNGEKLDHTDNKCQLHLGWGHSKNSHKYIKEINATGIGMGCNSGNAGVGDLEKNSHWWRFQRGPNGSYAMSRYQGTQNGGLAPAIFEQDDYNLDSQSVFLKNSFVGFMRLTQYHWLKLHEYAQSELLKSDCASVKITYDCVDGKNKKFEYSYGDLDEKEYQKRITAWKKEEKFKKEALNNKYKKELEILNRFEPLANCFGEGHEADPLPSKCDQEIIITKKTTLKKHCQDWIKSIDKTPEHDWQTPASLERPTDYNFPAKGKLN